MGSGSTSDRAYTIKDRTVASRPTAQLFSGGFPSGMYSHEYLFLFLVLKFLELNFLDFKALRERFVLNFHRFFNLDDIPSWKEIKKYDFYHLQHWGQRGNKPKNIFWDRIWFRASWTRLFLILCQIFSIFGDIFQIFTAPFPLAAFTLKNRQIW